MSGSTSRPRFEELLFRVSLDADDLPIAVAGECDRPADTDTARGRDATGRADLGTARSRADATDTASGGDASARADLVPGQRPPDRAATDPGPGRDASARADLAPGRGDGVPSPGIAPASAPGGEARSRSLAETLASMHLQWFAAEDEGRTEEPTEHKIQKAREEGKVAKSQDVSSSIVLLVSVVALLLLSRYLFNNSMEMVSYFLRQSTESDIFGDGTLMRAFYQYFIRLTLPIAMVAFAGAILGNVVQVGFLFTTKTITPDFNRIAPRFGKFFQRALLSTEALFNLAKSMGKVLFIVVLGVVNVAFRIGEITATLTAPFLQSFGLVAEIAFNMLLQTAILLLVLSIFDYLFQRRQHIESLKMTRQEVKEERRTYEGDPLIKSRMRQRMNELLSRNMLQNVPRADVVVTNPTHFAVAMEYDRVTMEAPTVIAKGQDNIAFRIREIAEESNVPIVENKPLARALYAEVEIGDTIPEKFYEAVVIVLKQVYQMSGRAAGGTDG